MLMTAWSAVAGCMVSLKISVLLRAQVDILGFVWVFWVIFWSGSMRADGETREEYLPRAEARRESGKRGFATWHTPHLG